MERNSGNHRGASGELLIIIADKSSGLLLKPTDVVQRSGALFLQRSHLQMNQFQPFSFTGINDFLAHLSGEEFKIVETLRALVFECIPDVKEKLSYNVPFYSRYKRICFIWPGSVPWGKKIKNGVEFGFCKGYLLSDASYLNIGNRKEVYIKTFYLLKEIDRETLRRLLYEAVIIDEKQAMFKKSKSFKNDNLLQ